MRACYLFVLALLLVGCSRSNTPAPSPSIAAVTPTPTPTQALNHHLYLANGGTVMRYEAVPEGLRKLNEVSIGKDDQGEEDSILDLSVSSEGIMVKGFFNWATFTPELKPVASLPPVKGEDNMYGELGFYPYPGGVLVPWGKRIAVFDYQIKRGAEVDIPGRTDHIIVHNKIGYVLDTAFSDHYLVKLDLSAPESPKVLEQCKFYDGEEHKVAHWIDPETSRWYVKLRSSLWVLNLKDLNDTPPREIKTSKREGDKLMPGSFEIANVTQKPPFWAAGTFEGQQAVFSLVTDGEGLKVDKSLPIETGKYVISAGKTTQLKLVGTRLYVTSANHSKLWILDVGGDQIRVVDTMEHYVSQLAVLPTK